MTFNDPIYTKFGPMYWYQRTEKHMWCLDIVGANKEGNQDYCARINIYADFTIIYIYPQTAERRGGSLGRTVELAKPTVSDIINRVIVELTEIGTIDPLAWVSQCLAE